MTADKEIAASTKPAAIQNKQSNNTSNSAATQRIKLLAALRKQSLTTLQIRRQLDILHPAARVQELRDIGHVITTHWQKEATECGREHRVARYMLTPEQSAYLSILKDLNNWRECLRRCNPAFAKRFIMEKLRPLCAVDDVGTTWLFIKLNLKGA